MTGRPPKNGHPARPTLAELGMTKRQSAEWQKLAQIPEPEFLDIMRELRATGCRVTTGGVVRAWHGAKARRLASLDRMAAELRAAGWTVFPPPSGDDRSPVRLSRLMRELKVAGLGPVAA